MINKEVDCRVLVAEEHMGIRENVGYSRNKNENKNKK